MKELKLNDRMKAAVLAGKKNVTRRIVKGQPELEGGDRFKVGDKVFEVIEVFCDKLHEMNYLDCMYEGVGTHSEFMDLWNEIYGNWDANPWVWVYTFKEVEGEKSEN